MDTLEQRTQKLDEISDIIEESLGKAVGLFPTNMVIPAIVNSLIRLVIVTHETPEKLEEFRDGFFRVMSNVVRAKKAENSSKSE